MVAIVKTHRLSAEEIRGEWITEEIFQANYLARMRMDADFPIGHAARAYSSTRENFVPTLVGEVAYLNSIDPNWKYSISYIWLPGYVSD